MKKREAVFSLFFLVWLVTLFVRSGIYVKRIIAETKNYFETPADHPEKLHFPEIQACSPQPLLENEETYHLWQYRSLGTKCEK